MDDKDPSKDKYDEFSDEQIKEILKEALYLKVKEKKQLPKRQELNNALIGTLGEFLTCFKLIGYDLQGNPINMTVYKENIEKSALDNAFMEEIGRFMNSRIG
jgi:hypothetical protein